MRLLSIIFVAAFTVIISSATAFAVPEKFGLDKDLTYIGFSVSYLLIFPATGRFDDFEGTFIIDPEYPESNQADITIKTTSIDAGTESRNRDIRAPALFNVDKYPEMIFHSSRVKLNSDNTGFITGDLTLRGITKAVTLNLVRVPGIGTQEMREDNNFSGGFAISGKIKRSDFGMDDYIMPISNTVTLFICYKIEKCNDKYLKSKNAKHQYNQ